MAPVPAVGRVFFPLDEELALLPGNLAPRQQEQLVHLASWMPFAKAAQKLGYLMSVDVSEETSRRLSEQAGARVEAVQQQHAQEPEPQSPRDGPPPARLVLSADGACISLLHRQWAEVRTVAIGVVDAPSAGEVPREVHVEELSYFSRLADAETFTQQAEVELRRRQVADATEVAAVTDGADWLQGFIDLHRPDALRVLDFPHAAQHAAELLAALAEAGLAAAAEPQLLGRLLHILKGRGPQHLLHLLERLPLPMREQEAVRKPMAYFQKREALMQYPQVRRQGWPIGSGMVESANKLVVQARLKGAGMHWQRDNVNPMLALRCGVCNQRWQATWALSCAQLRQHQAARRTARAARRIEAALLRCNPKLLESPALPSPAPTVPPKPMTPLLPAAPAATLPGSSRPSAQHPWKKFPACPPKAVAKK
jgi:hypothetical protein